MYRLQNYDPGLLGPRGQRAAAKSSPAWCELTHAFVQAFVVPAPTGDAAVDTAAIVETFQRAIAAGSGEIRFQAGNYWANAALPTIPTNRITVVGPGSGACELRYTGTGAAIRFEPPTFSTHQGGGVTGLTISGFGNTNPDAGGVYYGDIIGFSLVDVVSTAFIGERQFGFWADTPTHWSERASWIRVHADNCTIGIVFDNTGGTASHGWSRFLDVRVNVTAQPAGGFAQMGVLLRADASIYNSTLFLTVNVAGTAPDAPLAPTVMHVADTASAAHVNGAIYAELSSGTTAPGLSSSTTPPSSASRASSRSRGTRISRPTVASSWSARSVSRA